MFLENILKVLSFFKKKVVYHDFYLILFKKFWLSFRKFDQVNETRKKV